MKFTPQMVELIKNFNSIATAGIVFEAGKPLAVQDGNLLTNTGKTMVAVADLENPIEADFAMSDVLQFYSCLTSFEMPVVQIDEKTVSVMNENQPDNAFRLTKGSLTSVRSPSDINFPDDSENIMFTLDVDTYNKMIKGVSIVSAPMIAFIGNGTDITCQAIDPDSPTSNTYKIKIGDTSKTFRYLIPVTSISKIMRGFNYTVSISPRGAIRFTSDGPFALNYYIAVTYEVPK